MASSVLFLCCSEFFESTPQKKKAAGQTKLPKNVTPKKEVKTEFTTSTENSTKKGKFAVLAISQGSHSVIFKE